MFKFLLHETYTKRDVNGNVYHTVRITNPKNGKFFCTETCSISNVLHILYDIAWDYRFYYVTENCTNSAKISSLPEHIYLNNCRLDNEWKKELRKIGYRIPKGEK